MSLETMTKLATTTVGAGGTSSVTFSNISQNYTDLLVKISSRDDRTSNPGSWLYYSFNGSSAGQTNITLLGQGSSSALSTGASGNIIGLSNSATSTSSSFSNCEIQILNYSSNRAKSFSSESIFENNATRADQYLISGLWSNPSPITSITFSPDAGQVFLQNSTFTIYGIKNAAKTAGNSIKATGGNIVFDGTYVYHVFNASSTFTSTTALTADVLSVGGGGGGGWNNAGGGGGGEVDISRNLTIGAGVSKTVTIGAGGAPATSTAGAGANGGTTSFSSDTTSLGGGGGGTGDATNSALRLGQTGGSGGGGSLDNAGGGASGSNTNVGAAGFAVGSGPERYAGGGGGGATSAGGAANTSTRVSGAGGQGMALSTIFSTLNLGNITHFGSGGSGGIYVNGSTGTAGLAGSNAGTGGQQTSNGNVSPIDATPNAGGGGGGGSYTAVNSRNGSNGGSGIVIVRYKG